MVHIIRRLFLCMIAGQWAGCTTNQALRLGGTLARDFQGAKKLAA